MTDRVFHPHGVKMRMLQRLHALRQDVNVKGYANSVAARSPARFTSIYLYCYRNLIGRLEMELEHKSRQGHMV